MGHQNHGPSSLASGITRNSRTIIMSKINPMQIVEPAWPMFTTCPEPAIARTSPVPKPALSVGFGVRPPDQTVAVNRATTRSATARIPAALG